MRFMMRAVSIGLLAAPAASTASDTTTYTYDALGRLTASKDVQGSATTAASLSYDAAGNRSSYKVTLTGGGVAPSAAANDGVDTDSSSTEDANDNEDTSSQVDNGAADASAGSVNGSDDSSPTSASQVDQPG